MKMLCRMCLLESENMLCIFEHDSGQFQIAPTIGRHFWFEPSKDDPISIMICMTCWSTISDFHTYYLSIEGAHQRFLTEYSRIKNESQVTTLEDLKTEDTDDEYMGNSDSSIEKDTTEGLEKNTPDEISKVFVEIDNEFWNDGNKNAKKDNISSDEEPLIKKRTRTRAKNLKAKQEPEKRRRGPKKVCNNNPKNIDAGISSVKAEKDSVEASLPIQSISTRNDASLRANLENSVDIEIKEEESACNSDESNEPIDKPPKKRRDVKNRLEPVEESESATKKTPDLEHRKKNKAYDDEIAQFLRLKCELCSTPCKTFADIRKHYRTIHNKRPYVVCCTPRKFYNRVSVYEHIQKHKNPETFKCQFCEKVYSCAKTLRGHLITHDDSVEKSYQCEKCPQRFAKMSLLNQHQIRHIPKEEHRIACDICGKLFPTKNTMKTHRNAVHEKTYSKICHICAKIINGKTLFAKHQLEHVGIVDPKVKCEQCGIWLKNEFRLKVHTKKHHNEENTGVYICHICQKVSSSSEGLKSHIRYVHSTERKFVCNICEKSFKTSLNLKEHMTTHTGDILYTCPHCPNTFNSRANMYSHRKKMHRQEWEDSRRSRGLPVNE